ncbi:MAG TPA: protein kinase [Blastocatellia bacterium]|nr:protein kinase [Blastocatellia bacterium]
MAKWFPNWRDLSIGFQKETDVLPFNTLLQNRYRIERLLGKGGMGAVYLAEDEQYGMKVALKEALFDAPVLRKAFEREARLLERLSHPALPWVREHFSENGKQYLVMQYVDGEHLEQLLEERNCDGRGPFAVEKVLQWAYQLLNVLEYLHGRQPPIIHRDIKPLNLKLTPRGEIILLDFGLAKGAVAEMSQAASLLGYSPHYAPLEQMDGTGTDPRSDLYSLAATLYRLMTGHVPTSAASRAAATSRGQADPLRPANILNPQVPVAIAAVLVRALAQHPDERLASAVAMRQALRDAGQLNAPISEGYPRGSGPSISIVPGSLVAGLVGRAYPAAALAANGGTLPYTFSLLTGSLPPGMSLSSEGVISGTATQSGNFGFTVKATDANGCYGTQDYRLMINRPSDEAQMGSELSPTLGEDSAHNASLLSTYAGQTAPSAAPITGSVLRGEDLSATSRWSRPRTALMSSVTLAILLLIGTAWLYRQGIRKSAVNQPSAGATPTPMPAAFVEAMRYYVQLEPSGGKAGNAAGTEPVVANRWWKLHFLSSRSGYLYITGPNQKRMQATFLTAQPNRSWGVEHNRIEAGMDYVFPPKRDQWIRLAKGASSETYTVIFTPEPLTQPSFLTGSAEHELTVPEQGELAVLREKQGQQVQRETTGDQSIVRAGDRPFLPILFDIKLRRDK